MVVEVAYEERYWYPDDGGELWIAGYHVIDPGSGRYLAREAPELATRGLRVLGVAGARDHHAEALDSDEVGPGRPLRLRRDPENAHDPNAIAVLASAGDAGRLGPPRRRGGAGAAAGRRAALVGGRTAGAARLAPRIPLRAW